MSEYDDETTAEELEAQRQQKLMDQEAMDVADVRDILSRPGGIRFMARLLVAGHFYETTFKNNGYTSFHEGERNFVIENVLKYVLKADPVKFEALINAATRAFNILDNR